ncbi:Vacuolar protein sorting 16B [Carabus blaptoides fortunei]
MSKLEDDYWNASDTKPFNFEEESLNDFSTKNEEKSVSDNFTEGLHRSFIPINSILTQQCLNKILDDEPTEIGVDIKPKVPISQTIKKLILGEPYTLDTYRSSQNKIDLLDAAISSGDGNAILAIVLFLVKTLKKSLAYKVLSTKPAAVEHYVNYLSVRLNTSELTDILTMTGHSANVGIKLFKIIVDNTSHSESTNTLLRKLQTLYSNHYRSGISDEKDSELLKSYIALLEWQLSVQKYANMSGVLGQPLNKCLSICCQHYWGEPEEHLHSPMKLTKAQNVSERQLHWIFLDVKSANESWEEILKMFIKNNWFGNKKVLGTSLNVENIIVKLGERQAPPYILENFLSLMEDSERSLSLATRYKCHRYIIEFYVSQKDRASLLNYKSKITPQSEDYFFLEKVLCSTVTKWKT